MAENGGIDANDGTYKMGKGKIDNPSVTFVTSDADWVAMSNGKLKGTWAFMTGRLKVRGSSSRRQKTERDLSLEFQLGCNPDIWRRIDPLGLMCAEEVELAFHGAARTDTQLEVFYAGIPTCTPVRYSLY